MLGRGSYLTSLRKAEAAAFHFRSSRDDRRAGLLVAVGTTGDESAKTTEEVRESPDAVGALASISGRSSWPGVGRLRTWRPRARFIWLTRRVTRPAL